MLGNVWSAVTVTGCRGGKPRSSMATAASISATGWSTTIIGDAHARRASGPQVAATRAAAPAAKDRLLSRTPHDQHQPFRTPAGVGSIFKRLFQRVLHCQPRTATRPAASTVSAAVPFDCAVHRSAQARMKRRNIRQSHSLRLVNNCRGLSQEPQTGVMDMKTFKAGLAIAAALTLAS